MKLAVNRYSLEIIPETKIDEAYLEEVLGLMRDGDSVPLKRCNAIGLLCWGSAEAKEVEPNREAITGSVDSQTIPIPDSRIQFVCRHGSFWNPCKDCQGTFTNAV